MSHNTTIPTEPIGSIPRTDEVIKGLQPFGEGNISQAQLDALYEQAIHDTIRQFEATGSPVITDGERANPASQPTPWPDLITWRRMASKFHLPLVTYDSCPG